ncbi:kinetochore complex Sim4 subunit Fta1-domain-containing protein [Lophiotrema nucula]|uniref:Kinetochore complex Sim4 subunit Fta1-domain-containing protein n=1 Tax=Lophiotrema nucula TaxID=690887 RepID=A0A6A5ZRG8_9PLEO|nr:kinetochore complex Sim4 subunit Fta1-domain-containing protein [Lophiotrema nucula]
MADIPIYPLYHQTYRLYRVSPLHHGDASLLNERALRTHAKRLKEQLKGDNVRGVEIDLAAAEGALANLGTLELCDWELVGDEDAWIDRYNPEASQVSSVLTPERARGVEVTLDYDQAHTYSAMLLRDPEATKSPEGFTSLPLLMVKMPAPVREIFLNYLRTSFDAHVAPLRLAPTFLTNTLETYFKHLTAAGSTQSIRDQIRQLQIQLAFPSTPSPSLLRHIDINISSADVATFLKRGRNLPDSNTSPFTAALRIYLQKHLALALSHPKVSISKIQCHSFVIQSDKIKITAPEALSETSFSDASQVPDSSAGQLAVQELYASLVKEATGSGKFLHESMLGESRDSTPSSTGSGVRRGRKRAVSTTAAGNAKTKRSRG